MSCCKQGEGLEENYWQSGTVCLHGGAAMASQPRFILPLRFALPLGANQLRWKEIKMQPCIALSRFIVQLSRIPLVAVCAFHTAELSIKEVRCVGCYCLAVRAGSKANIDLSLNVYEKKEAKKKRKEHSVPVPPRIGVTHKRSPYMQGDSIFSVSQGE